MLAHKGLLQLSSQSLSYGFKLDVQPQRRGQGDVVDVGSGTALIPKKKSHATCRKMRTHLQTPLVNEATCRETNVTGFLPHLVPRIYIDA